MLLLGISALPCCCCHSQEQLQPGTAMVSHPFSKHNCINICMWRAQSCTASEYILILNTYCKVPCWVWHNQTLHKYSNFGNISLVHSEMKQSKKASLWHFQIFSVLQSAFIKLWQKKLCFALFHTTLNDVRKPSLVPRIYFKWLTLCCNWVTKLWREILVSLMS